MRHTLGTNFREYKLAEKEREGQGGERERGRRELRRDKVERIRERQIEMHLPLGPNGQMKIISCDILGYFLMNL